MVRRGSRSPGSSDHTVKTGGVDGLVRVLPVSDCARTISVPRCVAGPAAGLYNGAFLVIFEMEGSSMRHVLSALVQNQPGVLAHVSGMLASRNFNIDSLAVGETENPDLSRMTFVVRGDDKVLEQVRKQLEKLITIVKVLDISRESFVERDLMLIRISVEPDKRGEVRQLVEIFRGRIVDVGATSLMIEISGTEEKGEAFVDLVRPYGILELARTGRVALVREGRSMSDEA